MAPPLEYPECTLDWEAHPSAKPARIRILLVEAEAVPAEVPAVMPARILLVGAEAVLAVMPARIRILLVEAEAVLAVVLAARSARIRIHQQAEVLAARPARMCLEQQAKERHPIRPVAVAAVVVARPSSPAPARRR